MDPRETGALHVHHRRLEIAWWGPPPSEAPTLVLLHEGLGCVEMWKGFPGALAEATGMGVMAYSRLGYGGSDPCALPRPLMYMQDEGTFTLPAVIEAAGLRDFVLVGHSDGGSIALAYAGSDPAPGLKGVVTLAAHVFCEAISVQAITRARLDWEMGELREKLTRYHGPNTTCAFRGWNEAWLNPQFRYWSLAPYLPSVTAPVLALQGEADEYGTPAQLTAIAEGVGGAVETALLDCGHWPHREQRAETLGRITAFLHLHCRPE